MQTQYAPAPWTIGYNGDDELAVVSATGHPVCSVYAGQDWMLDGHDARIEANRNLIQAAPDLLDALQTILTMDVKGHQLQDRLQFSDAGRAILNKAQAAIKKAMGE